MLIFLRHKLTYLATPKTGSTAVEMALKPQAEIIFSKGRKHITAARYANKVAPFIEDTFGVHPATVAVMRDPVEQIRSWFKYRSQPRLKGTSLSTQDISFDTYVHEVIADDPPERAQIGRQFNFLTDGKGQVAVDHVFSHGHPAEFHAFLSAQLGQEVTIAPRNVSPARPAPLGMQTRAALETARAADFELYTSVVTAGGHLQS